MKPARKPSGPVDFGALRERLARAWAGTEFSLALSEKRARAAMDERARLLARAAPKAPEPALALEALVFQLGRERYAIESEHVHEIVRLTEFTRVPGAPDFVLGVMNLRGEVLPLFDLRPVLHVSAGALTDLSRVIVLGAERPELGVLADEALEIRSIPRARILAVPESIAGFGHELLLGVTEEALIVLDGGTMLTTERLFVERNAAAPSPERADSESRSS